MKILHICTDKNIGGAGRWIENLLQALDNTQFTSSVLLPKGAALTPQLKKLGVSVTEIAMRETSFDKKAIAALRREILRQNPDIVHTHGSFSGRIAAKLAGKKIVITRHWANLPQDSGRAKKNPLAGALNNYLSDKWIATAKLAADNLLQSGISARKVVSIPNGVLALEKKSPDWMNAKRRALATNGFVFGILARLEEVKGHKYLLDAAKILHDKDLDFTVLIAGSGSLEKSLKSQTKAQGLDNRVKFLGFYEDPAEFLNLLDVQINASYTETTCLAILEGFSLGIPAIASTGGGNPQLIKPTENGLLFTVGNAAELAAHMQEIMEQKTLYETLSQGAATCFMENYTAQVFAQKIGEVYKEVLSHGAH